MLCVVHCALRVARCVLCVVCVVRWMSFAVCCFLCVVCDLLCALCDYGVCCSVLVLRCFCLSVVAWC